MVSAGKYFVTGEFRFADDSKGASFPGAHVEVVLAYEYEALVRRCQDLQEDRQHTAGELVALAQRCRELEEEIEQHRKDAKRYLWLRENASDAHMWNDESTTQLSTKALTINQNHNIAHSSL